MNKHIIKHSLGLGEPIVFCGRSIPDNSKTVTVNQAVIATDTEICQNCIKSVIKKLNSKLK